MTFPWVLVEIPAFTPSAKGPGVHFRIFECWRFTAAVLVMAYHFLYSAPYGGREGIEFLHRLLPLLDMFFMISGFFIASRYGGKLNSLADYGRFMRRRFARLYPLHLAVTLFFAAVAVYAWSIGAEHYPYAHDLAALPMHILGLHALGTTDGLALNYVSWSVSAELFSYAMFPLIVIVYRWRGLAGLCGFFALWVMGLEFASRMGVFPSGHWTTADSFGAYRAFADFLMGSILAIVVGQRVFDIRSHWPGLFVTALALAAMISQVSAYISLALLACALLFTALAETARPDSTGRLAPLMRVTRVAFGIYLLHPVMEFFFLTVLWERWLGPLEVVNFYLYWLIPMVLTVLLAMTSEIFFEKRFGSWISGSRPKFALKDAKVASV